MLPAYSHVQRQPGIDLPVVLEKRIHIGHAITVDDPIRPAAHAEQTEKHVARRPTVGVPGVCCRAGRVSWTAPAPPNEEVRERQICQKPSSQTGKDKVPVHSFGFESGPHGVLALDPGNLIRNLVLRVRTVRRAEGAPDIKCTEYEYDRRQRLLWNHSLQPDLLVCVRQRVALAGHVSMKGHAGFVDKVRRQHGRELHDGKHVAVDLIIVPAGQLAAPDSLFPRILGVEEPPCQGMLGGREQIHIADVLIVGIFRGLAVQNILDAAIGRAGNVIAAVGILDSQDIESDRIDVGSVAGHLHGAQKRNRRISRLVRMIRRAHCRAESGLKTGRVAVAGGNRIEERVGRTLGGHSIALARALIAAEEEQLVLFDRTTQ